MPATSQEKVTPPVYPRHCQHSKPHPSRPVPRWMFPLVGLLSLIWFLVRVLPKPSRAAYPCQRAAAPLAGSFVLWLAGSAASLFALRCAKKSISNSRLILAGLCLLVAMSTGVWVLVVMPGQPALADELAPNVPIGAAKGLNPGRVVWMHDNGATNWAGPGDGHWWESSHTNQAAVDSMMSRALRALSGRREDKESWDAFFRYFNETHGNGDVGYRPGEKIAIKVNLVGCIYNNAGGTDPESYDLVRKVDYMNTAPQMILSLLRQLVRVAGAREADISVGDPLARFPNQYYEICRREFPNVRYLDHDGGNAQHPRTRVQPSKIPFFWSCRPEGKTQDFVPDAYAEAKYFISFANLKSHTLAGVTLTAKNHYGSLFRTPPESGYYNMHDTLAKNSPGYGKYRALVDLLGHAQTGGKALIYFIDGLYAGVHPIEDSPRKWNSAPFNGNWTSSLFASQDPVALDSVAFDFLRSEWNDYPHMLGTDDYLHEAARANNPPSGTFYDPDHPTPTVRLQSLGVHEHWDNPQSRQYSRNLRIGRGIELIKGSENGKS